MAESLAAYHAPAPDGEVVHPLGSAIHDRGGIAVLTGSLAPQGGGGEGRGHRLAELHRHRARL